MEEPSLIIYQYLCDKIVGSENIVKCRRIIYEVCNDVNNKRIYLQHGVRYISSGSKAEGLSLFGSDYDIMWVNPVFKVYEKSVFNDSFSTRNFLEPHIPLIMETDQAHPGFALLRILNYSSSWERFIITNQSGRFLSGKVYMTLTHANDTSGKYRINGPCISDDSNTVDVAMSLRCDKWPSVAQSWAIRPRSSGWPSTGLISEICDKGVLFVPVGSKSDSEKENPLEWRISFSESEKLLIHSWSHTQFLCYALIKILITDIVKKNKNMTKVICSYFLKTTMFWLSEEHDPKIWEPCNLLQCFLMCLGRLIYLNEINYIPNYFIPQHNMIDRRFVGQSRSELVFLLRTLHSMGWTCLLECDTFKEMHSISSTMLDLKSSLVRDLYRAMQCLPPNDDFKEFRNSVVETNRIKYAKKTRLLSLFHFAYASRRIADETSCRRYYENKQHYIQQKQWCSHALISTYADVMSGWLVMALFFHTRKQHYKSLEIVHYLQTICQFDVNEFAKSSDKETFIRILKRIKVLNFNFNVSEEICEFCNSRLIDTISCSPTVLLDYLSFSCYNELGDTAQCAQSLQYLIRTAEKEYTTSNPLQSAAACMYISKSFSLIGDFYNASRWGSIIMNLKNNK